MGCVLTGRLSTGKNTMTSRKRYRLLAAGAVLVVCGVAVAIGFWKTRHDVTTVSSALSDASTSSDRASAGAQLANGAAGGDRSNK